jgi:hypothetical protein
LRKFNEELNPHAYAMAATKLRKLGMTSRAEELEKWSHHQHNNIMMRNWESNIKIYQKFGEIELQFITDKLNPETGDHKFTGKFHIILIPDLDTFEDSLYEWRNKDENNFTGYFTLSIGIIPSDKETLDKCISLFNVAEFRGGVFWSLVVEMRFSVKQSILTPNHFNIYEFDRSSTGFIKIVDRSSGQKLKNILVSIFCNPKINYPSGYTDETNIYNKMEQEICARHGFSSDYGFSLENIGNYIKSIPTNEIIGKLNEKDKRI